MLLHIIAGGVPQIEGQELPQSFQTWPPQSAPMVHDGAVGGAGAGAWVAQHGGSGAKQEAPAGQQPSHG